MRSKSMAKTKNSKFGNFCLFLTAAPHFFGTAFEYIVFNPITPVLEQLYNETWVKRNNEPMPESTWIGLLSITISAIIIGSFIGALSTKFLLRVLSRKGTLCLAQIIHLPGILLVALVGKLTASYEVIIVGRIITGIFVGIGFTLIPVVVAELSERSTQATWQGAGGVALSFGVFVAAAVAHPKALGSYDLWPVAVALSGLPSIAYIIASYWIPYTPAYVLRKEGSDEAMKVLRKLRTGSKADIEEELEEIKKEIEGTDVVGIREIFELKQYRMQLIAVCCLYGNLMLCGINNFSLYSDRILTRAGIPADRVTFATIGMFAGQFFMSIIGTKFVVRFGARRVLLVASCVEMLSLVLFTIAQATQHLSSAAAYLSIAAATAFFMAWSGGTNLSNNALVGAVTTEPTRPTIFGFAGLVLWTTSWFVGFIPPYLEVAFGPYSLCIWLVFTILFFIYFVFFIPETKGLSVDEIQANMKVRRVSSRVPLRAEAKL